MLKFSPRECQVIQNLIDGGTRKTFAAEHGLKKATVSEYVRRAKEKAAAGNIGQLCMIYYKLKEIEK